MKSILLQLSFLIISVHLLAQTESTIAIGDASVERFKTYQIDYGDVNGNPFIEKDILKGYITFTNDNKSDQLDLQYDIYSKEFFQINEDGKEVVFGLMTVKEINMTGKQENYLFKRINPRKPTKFYEVLYESDEFDIYNDIKVNFREATDIGISKTEAKFHRKNNYFLMKKGEVPIKFKLKKKDLYKHFSAETKKQADRFLKEHKIKLKKSKDFKQLFKLLQN